MTAEASAPSVPNVVIGVSTPSPSSVSEAPSSQSPSEPPRDIAHADAAVQLELPVTPVAPPVRDTLIAPAMTDADDDAQPESEERVRVADEAEEEIEASKVEAKTDLSDTIVDTAKREVEESKAEEEEKVEAKPLPDAVPQDEETIPPAGDLAVHEDFFSEGDLARHAAQTDEDDLDEAALDKAQRKSDPAVVQRRAKLSRYVTWAVGVSAALCLIAVARTTFTSSSKTIASANAASAKSEVVVAKASPPPSVVADAPKAVAATTTAAPVAAAPAEPAKANPVGITGDAKEEKAKAKAALNKSKLADAIEAGEKSVALDETDSEAWLLLGAAYQEKGDLVNARNAYKSCIEKGTKDRFQRECRLFTR